MTNEGNERGHFAGFFLQGEMQFFSGDVKIGLGWIKWLIVGTK
jgi:hypothetical protein